MSQFESFVLVADGSWFCDYGQSFFFPSVLEHIVFNLIRIKFV